GHVDGRAAAVLRYLSAGLLGDEEHAGQVSVDGLVPQLLGHLLERLVAGDAGVVDQNVDVAEIADDFLVHLLDLCGVDDAVGIELRLVADLADDVADLTGQVAGGVAAQRHVGARPGQRHGAGPADTARG